MAYRNERYGDPAKQLERIQLAKIRNHHKCAACIHGREVLPGLAECMKKLKWPKDGFCLRWTLNESWKPKVAK